MKVDEEGGGLTEAVRRRPYSVVLLEGEFGPGDRLQADAADGELRFEKAGAVHVAA